MGMNTNAEGPWFELLEMHAVAQYVSDDVSEVYAMRADAPHFIRVHQDDASTALTLLTNDRAELIAGEARLTNLPGSVVAATIIAMLGDD